MPPEWKQLPPVDNPNLEAIRELAVEVLYGNMHFHERAMADPFEAETYVQGIGQRLVLMVGYPKGWNRLEIRGEERG